jgi:hypothetical protein
MFPDDDGNIFVYPSVENEPDASYLCNNVTSDQKIEACALWYYTDDSDIDSIISCGLLYCANSKFTAI